MTALLYISVSFPPKDSHEEPQRCQVALAKCDNHSERERPTCDSEPYLYLLLINNDPSVGGTTANNCSAVWANYSKLMHL